MREKELKPCPYSDKNKTVDRKIGNIHDNPELLGVERRLCSKCAKCPKVETCNHKRMEMIGFLEPVANDAQEIL